MINVNKYILFSKTSSFHVRTNSNENPLKSVEKVLNSVELENLREKKNFSELSKKTIKNQNSSLIDIYKFGLDSKIIDELMKEKIVKPSFIETNKINLKNCRIKGKNNVSNEQKFENMKDSYLRDLEKQKQSNIKNIKNEISVKYSKEIKISSGKSFSKQFQLNNKLSEINSAKGSNFEEFSRFLGLNIKKKIRKIEIKDEKLKNVPIKNFDRKTLFNRVIKQVLTCYFELKRLNLSVPEYLKSKHIFNKPYELKNSRSFFKSIKENDISQVNLMLESNKFLVFTYDDNQQTALHIATKKKYHDIMNLLIKYGSDVNSKDSAGRTSLHLACLNKNLKAVKVVLIKFLAINL